ncbi:type III PLP-dependent enzyme [Vibrio spartinae]|uniref:L-glutamyl-[BtrI acyl-carrier protein] decarboxylase n=1 Tax=Vibrio spartinae TaxID=1918945 RepID=A0ABX6R0I1_9VIBR|nr:type III PLP-dependent enzyme [Vibrio spartinae]QMV15006.1 L-glutamyl-[BtrI acyl-carrier protein] decarboxylase [Vibrio spartinae]
MHNFKFQTEYINSLHVDQVEIEKIAATVKTPFYVYSANQLKNHLITLKNTLPDALNYFYSLKANPNLSLVGIIHQQGVGCEVCSLAELETALAAGASPAEIIFVGPGKSEHELSRCVALGIKAVVVESLSELALLNKLAANAGVVQPFAFRINPNFTSEKARLVMSGKPRQFGIDEHLVLETLNHLDQYPHVALEGIHIYLGTRILDAEAVVANTRNILSLAETIQREYGVTLNFVDIGGGLGVPYYPRETELDLDAVATGIEPVIREFRDHFPETKLIMELGRFIVGRSGMFVTRVRYLKASKGKMFAVCDGGSNCHGAAAGLGSVIRKNFPIARLGAAHHAHDVQHYMLTGPLCTPTDLIGDDVPLPQLDEGDLIGIFHSGAYGPTASPVYFLSFGYPSEVLVDGDQLIVIRHADGVEHMLAQQQPQPLAV